MDAPRYATGKLKETVDRNMRIWRAKNRFQIRRKQILFDLKKGNTKRPTQVSIDKYDLKYSPEIGWY